MYSDLYVPIDNRSMDQICDMKEFNYQKQQVFIKKWFSTGKQKKLLLFHGLGSGKTCSSILAYEALKNKIKHTYICTPASLKENFRNEIKGKCGNYKEIPKSISVLSHQGFLKENPKLNNCLVIIDEVQNIISMEGSIYKEYFKALVSKGYTNLHLVLLSATPMFDQPSEIALTLNLLNIKKPIDTLDFYKTYVNTNRTIKNENDFVERVKGYVSSFRGISKKAYPSRTEMSVLCKMKEPQLSSYTQAVQGFMLNDMYFSQAFLSGPRVAANFVYPSGGFGTKYRPSESVLRKIMKMNTLSKYSTKFHRCLQNLKNVKGPAFVYSNFVAAGGINDFIIALKVNGYKEFTPSQKLKKGRFFGVFRTGKDKENKELVNYYNNPSNKNGNLLKVIVGSPAMKEGISLKNTRSVHLLDPYWNKSRTEQIIGRAIRFCSHVSLPQNERNVTIYHYITTINSKRKTVDQHIMNSSNLKNEIVKKFEKLLQKASVDCALFHNPNNLKVTDCKDLNNISNMVSQESMQNINTKIFIDNNNISLNHNNIEDSIEKLTEAYKIFKLFGIVVNLFNTKLKTFSFQNNSLNKFIKEINTNSSSNSKPYAKIQFKIIKSASIQSASIKNSNNNQNNNNKQGARHLKFNKGTLATSVKPQTGQGKKRNIIPKELKLCPKSRRPEDGLCPKKYPFLRKSNKKVCCFKKPGIGRNTGVVKTNNGKVYINGKIAQSLRFNQLSNVLKSLGKSINSKMKKKNLLNLLHK